MRVKPRKTGPRDGMYLKLLANSRSLPKPPKPWRQMSNLEQSRWKEIRALWRRTHYSSTYKRTAKIVITVRTKLGMSPEQFSEKLGVSIITLRRWERGYGYSPRPEVMKEIKNLGREKK